MFTGRGRRGTFTVYMHETGARGKGSARLVYSYDPGGGEGDWYTVMTQVEGKGMGLKGVKGEEVGRRGVRGEVNSNQLVWQVG